jgi:sec-independent protein translocase protein TatB
MSFTQIIVILIIALIVLGPEKLPQVARMVGKALAEFRRITGDFRSTIEGEIRELERDTALKEARDAFPPHIHYDLQTDEATLPADTSGPPLPAAGASQEPSSAAPVDRAASSDGSADETRAEQAETTSEKPSHGQSTSA